MLVKINGGDGTVFDVESVKWVNQRHLPRAEFASDEEMAEAGWNTPQHGRDPWARFTDRTGENLWAPVTLMETTEQEEAT